MDTRQKSVTNVYKKQKVMTATPEELTLMLYNACIKRIKFAISNIENRDMNKSNNNILKAQSIIRELKATLNMKYEISKEMAELYDYILKMLIQGNIKKDIESLTIAKELVEDFRETWYQLIRVNDKESVSNAI